MATYKNLPDDELLPLIKRELFSAIIGDILDKLGYLHCFLPPQVRPLREDMVVAGRAMPVLEVDLPADAGADRKPFGLMLEALDDLKTHEVYVAAGASPTYALWGELMSTRAMHLGAAIVPIGCNGSDRVYPGNAPFAKGGRIVYRFGPPLLPDGPELAPFRVQQAFRPLSREASREHGAAFQAATDVLMERINDLLDPPYQWSSDQTSDGVGGVDRFM